jgi:hypothetical protein
MPGQSAGTRALVLLARLVREVEAAREHSLVVKITLAQSKDARDAMAEARSILDQARAELAAAEDV